MNRGIKRERERIVYNAQKCIQNEYILDFYVKAWYSENEDRKNVSEKTFVLTQINKEGMKKNEENFVGIACCDHGFFRCVM